jgi:signal transduction histidine kinase
VEPLISEITGDGFANHGQETAFLADGDGNELARLGSMEGEGQTATHPGVTEALGGRSGFTYMKTTSMEHVVAYSPVNPPGWALVFEEPWEEVDTPYLRLTQFAPLILIPLLAFTLVALWFGATQIVKPLQHLEKLASDLAWGNFNAIEKRVGGVQEIRQLQTELIHMAHKVQDAQTSLHNYIGAITHGQEEERSRLARELHDDTLQALIALSQRIRLAQMKAKDEQMQQALAELDLLASNTILELRRLTRGLRPIYLDDLGLVTALEMLARENTSPGLSVIFLYEGIERRLEKALELTLFRITQEAMSNINHHAEASQAWITLNFQPNNVTLKIKDNGKGFTPPRSPAEFAPGGHFGLLGMHERSDLAGGKFSITSSEQGTVIQVIVKDVPSQ